MRRAATVAVLERRYRRLIRLYPSAWREKWSEELLGVLLDQAADEGRATVSRGDAINLVLTSLSVRCSDLLPATMKVLRERVSLLSLIGGAGVSLTCALRGEIGSGADEFWPTRSGISPSPFLTFDVVVYVLWLIGL